MNHFICALMERLSFLLAMGFLVSVSHARDWTGTNGKVIKGAKVITHTELDVTFLLANGKTVKVPLTRLSIKDRGYLSDSTPGDYPEDDEDGDEEKGGAENEGNAAAADDENLNWDDPWPDLVALIDKPTITVVTEDKKFIYESDHYRFTCNVRLNGSVVSNFSTMFEATRVYCRALPLAVSGGIKNNGKYDIFLFETKQQYVEAGGPPSSAGVFMRRGNKSYIMVPLTSLGVRKVGSGYMRDRDKSNGTLVHEITHQLTPGPYFSPGARGWFSEGLAEYLTSTPYRSGRFKVKSNFDDIVAYATAYGKKDTRGRALGEEFTAPALVDFMTMPYSQFAGGDANFNYGLGLVLTTYFLHLDGEGDGARMKEFLKELRKPMSKKERDEERALERGSAKGLQRIGAHGRRALDKLLDGRTFEELQDDITAGWRRKRVKIKFREPR